MGDRLMFEIDGILRSTKITYHGYRTAQARDIFFGCSLDEMPNLRKALLEQYAHQKDMGRVPDPQNHETFVLFHSDTDCLLPEGRILAITFTDLKIYFGGSVVVKDW
jgi:hypothetical protein